MDGFVLFSYAASIAVACMALVLSIVSSIQNKEPWTKFYIVFQSCLIGIMTLFFTDRLSIVFIASEKVQMILQFIIQTSMLLSMAFIIVFLPFFLSWVIAAPWRAKQRIVFYPIAAVYFVIGIFALLEGKPFLLSLFQTLIFLGVYTFCLVVLWVNLKKIENIQIRHVCLAIDIVSLSLIPLSILSLFFTVIRDFSYPIYILAFSIITMTHFFGRFRSDAKKKAKQPMMTMESLAQYKITEREFSVVILVCDGLTNKEIAQKLSISVNTVNNHVASIFQKMGVRSRIDLLKQLNEGLWA